MKKAQISSRLLAALIDTCILSFGAQAINAVFHLQSVQLGHAALGGTAFIGMLLTVAYFAAMEASPFGATIGKQVCGIRVVTMDGHRLSFVRSLLRGLGRLIPLGWLLVAFADKERALHDYFANSQVIEA
jgi:uncharacterized RDD family membrane protein YckC